MTKTGIVGKFGPKSDEYHNLYVPDESRYLEKLQNLTAKRKAIIRPEIEKEVQRIEVVLKELLGAIPSTDFTVDWFYRRLRITNKGIERRKIADSEIVECSKEYIRYIKTLCLGEDNPVKKKTKQEGFKGTEKLTENIVEKLFKELVDNRYIDGKSDITSFKRMFMLTDESGGKIFWIHKTKNPRQVNKRSLLRLFILLEKNEFIEIGHTFGTAEFSIISAYVFEMNGRHVKFNHSNKPDNKEKEVSDGSQTTITEIVDGLL